jgi:hypothetical protein
MSAHLIPRALGRAVHSRPATIKSVVEALSDELRAFDKKGAMGRLGAHEERAMIEAALAVASGRIAPQMKRKIA